MWFPGKPLGNTWKYWGSRKRKPCSKLRIKKLETFCAFIVIVSPTQLTLPTYDLINGNAVDSSQLEFSCRCENFQTWSKRYFLFISLGHWWPSPTHARLTSNWSRGSKLRQVRLSKDFFTGLLQELIFRRRPLLCRRVHGRGQRDHLVQRAGRRIWSNRHLEQHRGSSRWWKDQKCSA